MGISQNQLIDIALNVAGALTAGILWLVVVSIFRHRYQPAPARQTTPPHAPRATADRTVEGRKKVEFVSLRESAETTPAAASQRNRAEVIRIAREMLQSGTSNERVRELLPISEGELAMLTGR